MENEVNNTEKSDIQITDICERCHREFALTAFNTQSVDVPLCDDCYRLELAKKQATNGE